MKITSESIDQLKADLTNAKTYDDLMGPNGAIKKLLKSALEGMLDGELTTHLGYEKHSPLGKNSGNSRNGKSRKRLKNDLGQIEIEVPRDRNGSFEPLIVKKYERTMGPIEDKIISMYAKGMSTRDIQSHLRELYGLQLSPTFVSNITDKILSIASQWQNRPLEKMYPIVFFDAIHYKVKDEGIVKSKAAYTCLGVNVSGRKDLLGLWVGDSEGAAFWAGVMAELRNRGVEDILIACVDGLKGFPDAINAVFPKTDIQLCLIHVIRNTLRYIASKDKKFIIQEMKKIYSSPTEEAGLTKLKEMEEKWGKKYTVSFKPWRQNWQNIATFYRYPQEIKRIIYTTNAVEALHRQFRKVTKSKALFPHDESLKKMLYLAYRDISKKWIRPIDNWSYVISNLSVIFGDRIVKYL